MNWYDNTVRYQVSEGMIASEDWQLIVTNMEGVKLKAYPDPASGGKPWTIGVGHTLGVTPGDIITMERAMELLRVDVARFEATVNRRVTAPLTQYQFDALVSFVFNLGANNFTESSCTLLRLLNAEQYHLAANEFMKWTYAAGKQCKIKSNNCYGIVRRRKAEELMFRGLDWRDYDRFV